MADNSNLKNINRLKDEQIRVYKYENPEAFQEDIAKALGVTRWDVRRALGLLPKRKANKNSTSKRKSSPEPTGNTNTQEKITVSESGEGKSKQKTVHVEMSARPYSADELFEISGADPRIWEKDRYTSNTWTTPSANGFYQNWQSKLSLKRRKEANDVLFLEAMTEALESMKVERPYRQAKPKLQADGEYLYVLKIAQDAHFGKLCWRGDSNCDYDMPIATKLFRKCVDMALEETHHWKPEKFLFPVGSDFFNTDNTLMTTSKGTPQHDDARWPKVSRKGVELLIETIDRLSQIAPVVVPIVLGNHDEFRMFHVGMMLEFFYKDNPNVAIMNLDADGGINARARIAYQYYDCFIGLTHGEVKDKDLGDLFSAEFAEMWGKTKYREIYADHKHHSVDTEFPGYRVRRCSCICGTDKWHYDRGFDGSTRMGHCYIWKKGRGVVVPLELRVD